MGSLAVSPLRTAARLGGGLIRCREEDMGAATFASEVGLISKNPVELGRCQARDADKEMQQSQGRPEGELSLEPLLQPFWRTRSTCNVWAGFAM